MLCCQTCGHRKYSPILSLESIAIFTASWYLDVEFLGYLPCYNIFSFFCLFQSLSCGKANFRLVSRKRNITVFTYMQLVLCWANCKTVWFRKNAKICTVTLMCTMLSLTPSPPPPYFKWIHDFKYSRYDSSIWTSNKNLVENQNFSF